MADEASTRSSRSRSSRSSYGSDGSDSEVTIGENAHHDMSVGDRLDRFTIVDRLGAGYFGTVWEAEADAGADAEREHADEAHAPESRVAIKVTRADPTYFEMYDTEIEIMQALAPHPNVLQLLDTFSFQGSHGGTHYALVLPFIDGGDLFTYLRAHLSRGERVPPALARRWSRQLFAGLAHLADANIIHSDLKIENLLVSRALDLTIADFGTALREGGRLRLYGHTTQYRAPEVVLGHRFAKMTPAADVWSAATICFELHMPRGYTLFDVEEVDCEECEDPPEFRTDAAHLGRMVSIFGDFGKRSVRKVRDHFSSKGVFRATPPPPTSLLAVFEEDGGGSREEGERLCALLQPHFRYAPHQRASARSALQHSFFHAFEDGTQDERFSLDKAKEESPPADADAGHFGEAEAQGGTPAENGAQPTRPAT